MSNIKEVTYDAYESIIKVCSLKPDDLNFLNLSGRQAFYKQGYFGQGVIIAVIDSGIIDHKEFLNDDGESRILEGWDFSTDGDWNEQRGISRTNVQDGTGHGTHVSGSIVGKNVGIAPKAKILPVKIFNAMSEGSVLGVINAINFAVNKNVDIINMSLSIKASYFETNPHMLVLLKDAVSRAREKGILLFSAAGNSGVKEVLYPASLDHTICVGAVDYKKQAALFSTESDMVDICQVGVDVVSAWIDGGYRKISGTSMATPITAGIAALLLSKVKELSKNRPLFRDKIAVEEAVWGALKLNTIDIHEAGIDSKTGAGFCTLQPLSGVKMIFKEKHPMSINGELIPSDIMPMMVKVSGGYRFVVPLRHPFEGIGGFVGWDNIKKEASVIF